MSNEKVVGIVVGVVTGVVAARIGSEVINRLKEQIHQDELEEAKHTSFQQGWHAASTNSKNIYNRFQEMFGTPDETKGTTTKATSA